MIPSLQIILDKAKQRTINLCILRLAHQAGEEGVTKSYMLEELEKIAGKKPEIYVDAVLNDFTKKGFLSEQQNSYRITELGKQERVRLVTQQNATRKSRGGDDDDFGTGLPTPSFCR